MTMKNTDYKNKNHNFEYKNDTPCKCDSAGSFSKGFLWGVVIGGIIGVLLSPDKGTNTRKKIRKIAKEYEDKGKETLEKVKTEINKTKEKVEPFVDMAKEKAEEVKNTAEEDAEEGMNETDEILHDEMANKSNKTTARKYFKGVKKR
ncbi:MAG TPA: YtxH domain-containing protein [bacterium]|nr:YtxH domain-containing protein [bacterium]